MNHLISEVEGKVRNTKVEEEEEARRREKSMETRFLFITGGVVSGIGKGVTIASIGALFQAAGYRITIKKLDPYLNVDPGTMNPFEHGEVYVTETGEETDLDLGYYERFNELTMSGLNSASTGKLMLQTLTRERSGKYLGKTVQLIPHFTNEIIDFIRQEEEKYDLVLVEIGGNVGDIEAMTFMEAIRQMKLLFPERTASVHVTYLPYIQASKELKTKPTQVSVKQLMSSGIIPQMLICRSSYSLNQEIKDKLSVFTNVPRSGIIEAVDSRSVYEVPLIFHQQGVLPVLLRNLSLPPLEQEVPMIRWNHLMTRILYPKRSLRVGLVGKYVALEDAYKSLLEAIQHAAWSQEAEAQIVWIDAREEESVEEQIKSSEIDVMIVAGGFGKTGVIGKLRAIQYAREHQMPFLGICYGMQLAVVEYYQNVLGQKEANSIEFQEQASKLVVNYLTRWTHEGEVQSRDSSSHLGGTMRLGAHPTHLQPDSQISKIYGGATVVHERYRHRFEVDPSCTEELEKNGLRITAFPSPENPPFPEVLELPDQFFIGTQFHPEFKSTPFHPHPLFQALLQAVLG